MTGSLHKETFLFHCCPLSASVFNVINTKTADTLFCYLTNQISEA